MIQKECILCSSKTIFCRCLDMFLKSSNFKDITMISKNMNNEINECKYSFALNPEDMCPSGTSGAVIW